ncbi:MAG: hypothetical protein V1847_04900 [Candidatus Diapherotrites archaeon]
MADKPSADFVKSKFVAMSLGILFAVLCIAAIVRLVLDLWTYYPNPFFVGFDIVVIAVFAIQAIVFLARYKELW